jgi:hypothetical protein
MRAWPGESQLQVANTMTLSCIAHRRDQDASRSGARDVIGAPGAGENPRNKPLLSDTRSASGM